MHNIINTDNLMLAIKDVSAGNGTEQKRADSEVQIVKPATLLSDYSSLITSLVFLSTYICNLCLSCYVFLLVLEGCLQDFVLGYIICFCTLLLHFWLDGFALAQC